MRTEIRTFAAIKIKPEEKLLKQIEAFKLVFKNDRINWVDPDNLHLTLRFIGNTNREQLYDLVDRFEILSEETIGFELNIKGTGYFKSKGQPCVLFVKIAEHPSLISLVEKIEEQVTAVGFLPELKPFRPHLTLGRVKSVESRNRFFSLMDELEDCYYQKVMVDEFVLFQSILKSSGPEYRPIKKFKTPSQPGF